MEHKGLNSILVMEDDSREFHLISGFNSMQEAEFYSIEILSSHRFRTPLARARTDDSGEPVVDCSWLKKEIK